MIHFFLILMPSIVGERTRLSAYAKLEARTALRYVQCGQCRYIYIEREKIARSHH